MKEWLVVPTIKIVKGRILLTNALSFDCLKVPEAQSKGQSTKTF
ncbi:hypothetical protein [Flavobacterium sp.]